MRLRFGDGTVPSTRRSRPVPQTWVGYCDEHAELVRRWFRTCDEKPIGEP